jgi:hypothetical protein
MVFFIWAGYFLWAVLFMISAIALIKHRIPAGADKPVFFLRLIPAGINFISLASFSYIFIFHKGSHESFHTFYDDVWLLWDKIYAPLCLLNIGNMGMLIIQFIIMRKIIFKDKKLYSLALILESILSLLFILPKTPVVP